MMLACLLVAVWLLCGAGLRSRFVIFDRIYVPPAVIGGFVGLLSMQAVNQFDTSFKEPLIQAAASLKDWPGTLIAVVFAGMLLPRATLPWKQSVRSAGREVLMAWIIILGQTAIGLLATWLIIKPFFDVPATFGMLIETGFAGGHGTATAMGQVFSSPRIDFPEGKDLGLLMATIGLVYGTLSGIFWINLAVRWGWVSRSKVTVNPADETVSEVGSRCDDRREHFSRGLEPLLVQAVWLALALAIGLVMQSTVGYLAERADKSKALTLSRSPTYRGNNSSPLSPDYSGHKSSPLSADYRGDKSSPLSPGTPGERVGVRGKEVSSFQSPVSRSEPEIDRLVPMTEEMATGPDTDLLKEKVSFVAVLGSFPLFIYTLIGGLVLRKTMKTCGVGHLIDEGSIARWTSIAMDLLVVAAIATLNPASLAQLAVPFLVLVICGMIWTAICLLVISRRILPPTHWFELGLINYGMSTGVTATGFVLLRIVDPELKTDAAKEYAIAAPFSAPFIGGGILTIGLPLLVLERIPIGLSAITLTTIVVVLCAIGYWITRRDEVN